MFHSEIELKEGALFVTDVHFNKPKGEDAFLKLLEKIQKGELRPPQLFLLGDIFDALFGGVPYTALHNHEVIELLNRLGEQIEIVYLHGESVAAVWQVEKLVYFLKKTS